MDEKISIIMTSYNYAKYIQEAIISVKNQTYTNWELIIIDDASSDNSVEIIEKYLSDPRVKLVINEKNLGLAKTLQKGISYAEGKWLAFLESDDIFMPNSIEEKMKATTQGADIVFTAVKAFGSKDAKAHHAEYIDNLNKHITKLDTSRFINNFQDIAYKTNIIPTFSCVLLKKELLLKCKFNPICKSALDHYLWAQLSDAKLFYINNELTKWRLHKDSYINTDNNSWLKKFLFNISLYKQTIKNENILKKAILIFNYTRKRIIYLRISRKNIKINLFNSRFIYERDLD